MAFFKINGNTPKAPTEISLSLEVLDKAERTMDGTMVVDIIGSKEKIGVKWDYLADADLKLLAKETNGGAFVTIEYNSPAQSEIKRITARAEGLTYAPFYDWTKGKLLWRDVSVSFVER